MTFDFSAILVLATFVTGLICLYDAIYLRPARVARSRIQENDLLKSLAKSKKRMVTPDLKELRKQQIPTLVEYSRSLFPVLFIVLLVRSFLFEPYQIPSGSMLPTLRIGDFILVNKFTYGARLPVVHTKVLPGRAPDPGEVLVFRAPFDPATNFIKRVIGVPGDLIEIRNNELYRNNRKVPQGMISSPELETDYPGFRIFNQKLMDEKNFLILESEYYNTGNGRWQVPEGSYFVLGDNRGNSHDSRFWGFVPDDHIVGRAVLVWMHWDSLLSLPSFASVGFIDENLYP